MAVPAAGLPAWSERFRTRAWALVLPLSIAVVVAAIGLLPSTADVLTWVALLLVPAGCALALGWAAHGARPTHAGLAVAAAGARLGGARQPASGRSRRSLLIVGSAVTLGRLLAGAAPLPLLKAGVVAMAAVDAWLVFSNRLQGTERGPRGGVAGARAPAASVRVASAPRARATATSSQPRSSAGSSPPSAAHSSRPPSDWSSVSLCWDQLFLVYDVLPATIPPAVVLVRATSDDPVPAPGKEQP